MQLTSSMATAIDFSFFADMLIPIFLARNDCKLTAKKGRNMSIQLMTPQQFVDANPAFSMGALRNYIFYEDVNGLKAIGAIKRIGRKILIDQELFYDWVATSPQPTGGANARH